MSTSPEVRTSARGPDPVRRLARRAGVGVLSAVMASGAALPLVATPASASLTGPGVDAGQNITVFHNIDMVAVFGFGPVGSTVTVDVFRGTAKIGTATGPAVDGGDGPGLEVNHGPEGTAQPGDCWIGAAPDVRPGDRIVVTHAGDVDEVTVDDIHFTGGPVADGDDVLVHGVALRADGTAIAASALDSAEFRDDTGKYRTAPAVVARSGVAGGFTLRYSPPYLDPDGRNRDNLTQAQRRSALLTQDGHAIGFGHTEPLPPEAMLVDGLTDVPGHAPGCGGTPAEPPEPEPFEPGPDDVVAPPSPSFTPAGGTYTAAQSVRLASEAGATIRYTSGTGTDPNAWTLYTGPINVSTSRVLKAVAFDAAGNRSAIVQQTYTINAPTTVTTRTLVLTATADTMARQIAPNTRYGSTNPLRSDARATSSTRSRDTSYLKFAIPALAAGETITGARLGLNVTNGTGNGPAVYRTATGWLESGTTGLTWNRQPGRSSSTANGNFGSVATGKRSTALSLAGFGPSRTMSFQLYADSTDDLSFSSRESGTAGNRPQLILTIRKG